MDDEWFMTAAREAEKSSRAKLVREQEEQTRLRREEQERERLKRNMERAARAPTAADIRAAAAAYGVPQSVDPVPAAFDPMNPDQGLQAILRYIRSGKTPDEILERGGEWITRVTMAVSDVTRAAFPETDD